jgi:hypothetical protein
VSANVRIFAPQIGAARSSVSEGAKEHHAMSTILIVILLILVVGATAAGLYAVHKEKEAISALRRATCSRRSSSMP